jgi:hypothetical protein
LPHAEAAFAAHPDATIIASFPGIGAPTGARILAEIGDDRSRFADARGLKAYAGSAPITGPAASPQRGDQADQESATSRRRLRLDVLQPHRNGGRARTTTGGGHTATPTSQRNATCSTDSSAACTTA